MRFHCNISNGMVRGMRFANGYYETNSRKEIEFLQGFGGQDGCIVTPITDQPETGEDVAEPNEDTEEPAKPNKRHKR